MEATKEAIETLYRVFARYRAATPVKGCPCCTSEAEEAGLSAGPLRRLQVEDFGDYPSSALYTWGDKNDFKHFLPRILELMVAPLLGQKSKSLMISEQSLFSKLPYAGWESWPIEERKAIGTFVRAVWLDLLQVYPSPIHSDDWLECIGIVEGTLGPGLDAIESAPPCAAASYLADFIDRHGNALFSEPWSWIWWGKGDDSADSFFQGPKPRAILMKAFEAHLEHADSDHWAHAIDTLDLLVLGSAVISTGPT